MTDELGTPTIEHYVLEPFTDPRGEMLAMRAVWPDQTYVFLRQYDYKAEWRKTYALWADLEEGFAPYRCRQVDADEFADLLEGQDMRAPSAKEWETLYWAPDGTRTVAGGPGKDRSPEPYGR